MSRRYISIAEAAEYLKISDRTVRRLIADGELTGYSIGRGHRMLRVDLDEIDGNLMRPIGFHWNDPSAGDRHCGAGAVTAMGLTGRGPLTDPASTRPTPGLSAGHANAGSCRGRRAASAQTMTRKDDPHGDEGNPNCDHRYPRGGEWCAICGRYRHADQVKAEP
jgi:excisionase family DNA binding protein